MPSRERTEAPVVISGILPGAAMVAGLGPPRTECGVGGLMPWAGHLWAITYVSSGRKSGVGTGLYEMGENLVLRKHPAGVVGTFANRMVHYPSNQMILGPHIIDAQRKVRTFKALLSYRLGATMMHLDDPQNKVYFLGMEGHFFEADVRTLKVRQIGDLVKDLKLGSDCQPHFKAGFTFEGRVVVANNTYDEKEFLGERDAGRLAEWDGRKWTILARAPFNEVWGRRKLGGAVFATGWDRASAILMVKTRGSWSTYRLPKASHTFDHYWATEWPRIRELDHERLLMDCHGMFYELPLHAYGGRLCGVRPVSTHLAVVPDFCEWRGLLVFGLNQNTSSSGDNVLSGEPHAGLWMGKLDDLWRFGKPAGWGGPWRKQTIKPGRPSDPYLMTGFDRKSLHLAHESRERVTFALEVDFLGDGTWKEYATVPVGAKGYAHHEFPAGFSAHWVRVTANRACVATAHFTYT